MGSPKLFFFSRPIAALLPLILIPGLSTSLVQRPESVCDAEAFLTTRRAIVTISPAQVVANPWQGQHQVYGLFMLPRQVPPQAAVLLRVEGVGVYCDAAVNDGIQVSGIQAQPGYYLMRDHIRTRTAVGLMVQGKFDRIKAPAAWSLAYHTGAIAAP